MSNNNTLLSGGNAGRPNYVAPASPWTVFCAFNNTVGVDLTAYPWTDPLDQRPAANQWVDTFTTGVSITTEVSGALSVARINAPGAGNIRSRLLNAGFASTRIECVTNFPTAPATAGEGGIIFRGDGVASPVNYFLGNVRYDGTAADYVLRIVQYVVGIPIVQVETPLVGNPWSGGARTLVITDNGALMELYFKDAPATKASYSSSGLSGNTFIGLRGNAGAGAGWNNFIWEDLGAV